MTCKITGWYGRTGNNMQQITNALYFSSKNHRKLECLQSHEIFKPFTVDFSTSSNKNLEDCFESKFFYYRTSKKVKSCDVDFICDPDDCDKQRSILAKKYVRKFLNFDINKIEPYSQNTVVIHLRCGDIFGVNPHDCYVPNPLSYYRKVIQSYDRAIIVTEDSTNFLVKELLNLKNVEVKSSDVKTDFMTLLKAKSLCTSGVGTFSIASALLSKNLEKLHCTSLYLDNHLNPEMIRYDKDVEVRMTHINEDEYIKIGAWECSKNQIKKIMQYEVNI